MNFMAVIIAVFCANGKPLGRFIDVILQRLMPL